MSDVIITESYLEDIADAIRDRNKTNQKYKIHEMDEAIRDLHNSLNPKWVRPSDWPDYSQMDLTGQEVIYLTYDCSYADQGLSIRVYGNYTVQRGNITSGVSIPSSTAVNCNSGTTYSEALPTNEGNYVVYKITSQDGASLTRFAFARRNIDTSSQYIFGETQPCIERYCRIPNWIGLANFSEHQYFNIIIKKGVILFGE